MELIENGNLVGPMNGTVVSGAVLVSGKKGLALYTNGVDQYVDFGYQGDTCLGYFILCIHGWVTALWVKSEDTGYGVVMDTGYYARHGAMFFFTSNRSPRFVFHTGDKNWYVSAMPEEGWIHVVVTWQQCYGTKLYIDGELVDTYTHQYIKPGPAGDFSPFVLGANCRHDFRFKGKLDELRVWDTVMSDDEVKNLYTVDAGLK